MAGTDTEEREEGEVITPEKPKAESVHPLENVWTLWFDTSTGQGQKNVQTWGAGLKPIYDFSTVEQFWAMFNNLIPPSKLQHGTDIYIFKKGIEPKWEHHKCEKGGKWTIPLPKDKTSLDKCWLEVLLALIGEQFKEGDDICGAIVQVRMSGPRLALWTMTARDEAMQLSLGRKLKEILSLGDRDKIGFRSHEDALQMGRRAGDKYTM